MPRYFIYALVFLFLAGCVVSCAHMRGESSLEKPPISSEQSTTIFNDSPDITWTLYGNEKCGYEIKYPEGWEAVEAAPKSGSGTAIAREILYGYEMQKVTFVEKDHGLWRAEFQIRVLANPHSYSLEDWVQEYDETDDVFGGSLIQEQTETTLDGKLAVGLSIFGFDHEERAIAATNETGWVYYLSFAGANPNDPDVERHKLIYAAMVESFSFIE